MSLRCWAYLPLYLAGSAAAQNTLPLDEQLTRCAQNDFGACTAAALQHFQGTQAPKDYQRATSLLGYACSQRYGDACWQATKLQPAFRNANGNSTCAVKMERNALPDAGFTSPIFAYQCTPALEQGGDTAESTACRFGSVEACDGLKRRDGAKSTPLVKSKAIAKVERWDSEALRTSGPIMPVVGADGRTVWVADEDRLHGFDSPTGAPLGPPLSVGEGRDIIALGGNDAPVAVLAGESTTRMWSVLDGGMRQIADSGHALSAALSADGGTAVLFMCSRTYSCIGDATWVELRDTATGALKRTVKLDDTVHRVAISPSGNVFVTSSDRGRVTLHRGNQDSVLEKQSKQYLTTLDVSDDGTVVVSEGKRVRVFRPKGKPVLELKPFTSAVLSPDGKTIALAGSGTIAFADVTSGRLVENPVGIFTPDSEVPSMRFSHDGKLLVVLPSGQHGALLRLKGSPPPTALTSTTQWSQMQAPAPPPQYVPPPISIDGSVTVQVMRDGAPAVGAVVTLEPSIQEIQFSRLPKRTATTGANGKVLFEKLHRIQWTATAEIPGYLAAETVYQLSSTQAVPLVLELKPAARLEAQVLNSAAQPVDGAEVTVFVERWSKNTVLLKGHTQATGRAVLGYLPGYAGNYFVSARAPDGAVALQEVAVVGPGTRNVSLKVGQADALRVQVLDELRRPVPGAFVDPQQTPTDERGEAIIFAPAQRGDDLRLTIHHETSVQTVVAKRPKSPGALEAVIRVAKIEVQEAADMHIWHAQLGSPSTNLNGSAHLSGLWPGEHSLLRPGEKKTGQRNEYAQVTLAAGERKVLPLSVFKPGAKLRGRIVDEALKLPRLGFELTTGCVSGRNLTASYGSQVCSAISGPSGDFEFESLQPGRHLVVIRHPSFAEKIIAVDVAPGGTELGNVTVFPLRTFDMSRPSPGDTLNLQWPGFNLNLGKGAPVVSKVTYSQNALKPGDTLVACNGVELTGLNAARSRHAPRLVVRRATMIARFSLFGAVCFLAVPFQRAVAKEACELPALEAVGASADRPDQGCAAVVRALAVKRLTEAKADDADPHADEMHALPKAEDIARCSALLLGKGGRFFLEPDVDADQWLPGGLAMQGIQDLRQTFSRGRTAEAASTVAYNAVTFAACDIHFPVYVDYAAPISGFGRSRDGRYLWVVHAGDRRYSGASVPYYLKGSALSVVDLKTLTTQHISLDALGFEIQSIAATIEGEQLLVRLKDVWNLGRDKRLYLQCSLSATTCELKPTLSPTGFPKQGVLEVTASDIYWWEDLPVSAKLPPDVNVLRRTVRVSPDQKQMTYVVEKNDNHRVSRTLFVADLSGRKARRVASGIGLFHVEWLSPDRFVFEEDPKPTAAFTAIHQKAMATPEAKALIAEAKKSKDDYLQSSLDLWVLRYVEGEIQEGRLKPLSPRDAQEERLFEYRTTTGKVTPFNKLRHARLFGEFLYPNARADVPAD